MFPWWQLGACSEKSNLVFTFHVNNLVSGLPGRDGLPVKSGYSSSPQWTMHIHIKTACLFTKAKTVHVPDKLALARSLCLCPWPCPKWCRTKDLLPHDHRQACCTTSNPMYTTRYQHVIGGEGHGFPSLCSLRSHPSPTLTDRQLLMSHRTGPCSNSCDDTSCPNQCLPPIYPFNLFSVLTLDFKA